MSQVIFAADNSIQGITSSITSTPIGSGYIYAYNTNLSSLSTNSLLNINNLNATSTTIFTNLNSISTNSMLNINNLNATSTTIFNNLNSISTNSMLNINNLNATSTSLFNKTNFTNLIVSGASTINSSLNVVGIINGSGTALTNLNYNAIINAPSLSYYASNSKVDSLSTNSMLLINNLTTTSGTIFNNLNSLSSSSVLSINNLNATSTTLFTNLNSLSSSSVLSINNLNATSTTLFTNLNSLSSSSVLSINNLNATSTSIFGLVNGHTASMSNLNATSTTIFTNLNSLSSSSVLSINNLNATSTTLFTNLNSLSSASTLSINNLIATSGTTFNNLNSLSSASTLSINNLNATSTTLFTNLNSLSSASTLSINNLNATSTTLFTNLNSISSASTLSINNLNATSTTIFNTLGSKQNNLTFSNPLLNTSNTISLKYDNTKLNVDASGNLTVIGGTSQWTTTGTTIFYNTGKVGIGTTGSINASLDVLGVANIHNGTRFAALNYTLNPGSLIIGSSGLNYGGGTNWNGGNAAGLLMECDNNTEIVVYDNGKRLASLMYYEGDTTNKITIGRNMGWGAITSVNLNGNVYMSGFVGINATTLLSRFTIRMSYNDGNAGGLCIDSSDPSVYNLRIFSYVQAGYQIGYNFQVNNIASSVNAITLNYDGGVNIGNYLSIAGRSVYNNLFNSSGFGHGTITDFNSITDFGYRFISAPATNGPGTTSNPVSQYYTWMIGLGSDYGFNLFGAQFALPRGVANPILSIRYRENSGVWGGWSGITATSLSGSAIFNSNEWIRSNDGSSQRIFFGTNARTYYQGFGANSGDVNHEWRNHQGSTTMQLTQPGSLYLSGTIVPTMLSVANSGTDYVGVQINTTSGSSYQYPLMIMFGSFTGFHRCFVDDELFDINDIQTFKNTYIGRIVVSTGKIATDTKDNEEWEIKYDKEGITIEDSHPIVQLSRKKKDKRVFGVLGLLGRNNSRPERMIVNSLGEGAIWVCNSNGNIENGDYIQSSDYLGYGEKQDDDLLHNYTVAKATIDCNFELESPYYNCFELEGTNYRIAFIACTYHCG